MAHARGAAAWGGQCQFECLGDVAGCHGGAELPGDDIAGEVVEYGGYPGPNSFGSFGVSNIFSGGTRGCKKGPGFPPALHLPIPQPQFLRWELTAIGRSSPAVASMPKPGPLRNKAPIPEERHLACDDLWLKVDCYTSLKRAVWMPGAPWWTHTTEIMGRVSPSLSR